MLHVVHVITDLEVGGAQMMLHKLLSHTDRAEFRTTVVSIAGEGPLTDSFRALTEVVSLDYDRKGLPIVPAFRLARLLRRLRPDVVQTWMFHADLLGGVAARLGTTATVLWNIRTSALGNPSRGMRAALRFLAVLSRAVPFEIVSCSVRARDTLVGLGYDRSRFVIVPNGFDLERFRPDLPARDEVRRELNFDPATQLVGLIARWHPIKDHAMFIRAARRVASQRAGVGFVLCGEDVTEDNEALVAMIRQTGFAGCFRLLGRRNDVARLTAALDVACSSSASVEAFSNAIGEAMACGVPVVATDVGDSAFLVDDAGRIVKPGDDRALAEECLALLSMPESERIDLGRTARRRIEGYFEIGVVTRMYESLYRRAARRERSPAGGFTHHGGTS